MNPPVITTPKSTQKSTAHGPLKRKRAASMDQASIPLNDRMSSKDPHFPKEACIVQTANPFAPTLAGPAASSSQRLTLTQRFQYVKPVYPSAGNQIPDFSKAGSFDHTSFLCMHEIEISLILSSLPNSKAW
jgi:hypothetical protein